MTTEQIDLASVKRLIDNVWELKKQVQTLTQKLDISENERTDLAGQVSSKEQWFNDEISKLKSTYLSESQQIEQSTKAHIDELVSTHAEEKQSLIDDYEAKLASTITELQQKNDALCQSMEKLSHENQSIINRIRGIES